jgi:hypothetical protein
MNDNASAGRSRQRRSRLRAGVLAAALAGIVPLAAACGGSSGSTAGLLNLQTITAKALSYSKCMRSHGITNFPDPTVQNSATRKGAGFSLAGIDTSSPQYQSADKACKKLTGFGHVSPAMLQQAMSTLLKYAECMRSHGITNFPDPVESGTGVHVGPGPDSGIDQNSPQYKAADKACRPLLPGGGP